MGFIHKKHIDVLYFIQGSICIYILASKLIRQRLEAFESFMLI